MEVTRQTPQQNLQKNLRDLIKSGHVIPVANAEHTRVSSTVNGKEKMFHVDDQGRVYDQRTGKEFVLRQ